MRTRIPTGHALTVGSRNNPVMRTGSPAFAPPKPTGMREPGTDYVTIISRPGVSTWGARDTERQPAKR
jgi:hypothetical protein